MQLVIDVDDLAASKPGLNLLLELKEHYPDFKITCFTPAMDQSVANGKMPKKKLEEWVKLIKQYPWIEIAPHGFLHLEHEMECTYEEAIKIIESCEEIFNELGIPFKKIWKSPYWQTSLDCYAALRDKGYVVAIDKNQPIPQIPKLKYYVFNKSLEEPITGIETDPVIKWHGHIGGSFYNDISLCIDSVTTAPMTADFLTISEYIDTYGYEIVD